MENPVPQQPESQSASGGGKAVASLVLGIVGMLAWCLPILGLPVGIVGLILGIVDQNSPNRGFALTGIVLSIITIVLSIINAIAGVMMQVNA